MSLTSNLSDAFTRVATESKALRTLINGNAVDLAALTTTAKGNLVAAINEVDSAASNAGATTLDELTDVTITTPAAGHILRYDGLGGFVNVLGTDHFQPLDADLTSIAALTTTTYGRAFLTLVNQAGLMGLIQAASETAQGKVELATAAETSTGTDTTRAVHPAGLKSTLDSRISGLSSTYQPLDSDLTNIAALATTAYGRAFLTLADQAGLMALIPAATDLVAGKVELATSVETTTGTDATRATTPAGVKAATDAAIASLVDTAPGTLDTLNEIAAALGDDPNFASTMTTALGNRVRVDTATQGLTALQQGNARTNIAAASAADVGDTSTNFVAVFEAGLV